MNQRYPYLKPLPTAPLWSKQETFASSAERRKPRTVAHQLHRYVSIINNTTINTYGPQAHRYRAEPFPQHQEAISQRKINLLTKAPPSQFTKLAPSNPASGQLPGISRNALKGSAISKPPTSTRLKSAKQGVVEEPLAKSSLAILQQSTAGRKHKEVLAFPQTQATPLITLTRPTPPVSRAPSINIASGSQKAAMTRAHDHQTAGGVPIPPRRPHANFSPIATPATTTLSVDLVYKTKYEEERKLAHRFQREFVPTKAALEGERQRLAALEEQLIIQRAKASQKEKYSDHYKWLYERKKAETDRLQKRLQKQPGSGERGRDFEAEGGNEVSPASLETPLCLESSVELSCLIKTRSQGREASTTSQTIHELSSCASPQALCPSNQRPRIETRTEEPQATYELFAGASHQVLRRSNPAMRIETQVTSKARPKSPEAIHEVLLLMPEMRDSLADEPEFTTGQLRYQQLLHSAEEYAEPTSWFSQGSDTDCETDESNVEDDELYELPSPPDPPTLLAELTKSPSSHFSHSTTHSDSDQNELYGTPSPPAILLELDSFSNSTDDNDAEESEEPPRPAAAIYTFGTPRIEAVPAVFRVPIPSLTLDSLIDYEDPESSINEVAMKMDGWEWCSVPDLGLRDPRE